MSNDQLRERIVDACWSSLKENWMDQSVAAELRAKIADTVRATFSEERITELMAIVQQDQIVEAISTLISAQLTENGHLERRAQREATAARLGIGPAHGKN